eukprot:11228359-Lingulodinium_polyedra.AAC.2
MSMLRSRSESGAGAPMPPALTAPNFYRQLIGRRCCAMSRLRPPSILVARVHFGGPDCAQFS